MSDIQKILRHEMRNVLTILNFAIDDATMSSEDKSHIQHLADRLNILLQYEDITLEKPPILLPQKISVQEIFALLESSIEDEAPSKKVTFGAQDDIVQIDMNTTFEAIKNITLYVCQQSQEGVTIHFCPEAVQIDIVYKISPAGIEKLHQIPLQECLEQKNTSNCYLLYQMGLYVLGKTGHAIAKTNDTISLSLAPKEKNYKKSLIF